MEGYLLVKKTQVSCYRKTPLYILNRETGYVLYKPENMNIQGDQYASDNFPDLYINFGDKFEASEELRKELKKALINKINHGRIDEVKQSLCEIVSETFNNLNDESIETVPETIDIIYEGFATTSKVLKEFHDISYAGYPLVTHSVNVMILTLLYCLDKKMTEKETKRLSLCALLHDVGVTKIPKGIVSYPRRLSDQQFLEYQSHTAIGHDIVKQNESIDTSIAIGILEHHERIDGSGYPRGIANISFEAKLIGLIDSFDSLTNSEKAHRKKKRPFDAMLLLRDEVVNSGRFDKSIYQSLCQSLGRKPF